MLMKNDFMSQFNEFHSMYGFHMTFHMLREKSHEMPRCLLDLDIHLPHNPTKQSSKRGLHIFSFSRKVAISLSSIPNEYIKVFFFLCFLIPLILAQIIIDADKS